MFLRVIRLILTVLFVIIGSYILWINWRLYYQPKMQCADNVCFNNDLLKQLRYLRVEITERNGATKMQNIYPEGFVFTNVLYGLAWCDFRTGLTDGSALAKESEQALLWSIRAIDSEEGRSIFPTDTDLHYGAYYVGWLNYLRGQYIKSVGLPQADPQVIKAFQSDCQSIALAISNTQSPYLASYQGLCWPADNVVCLSTLALHDQLFALEYKGIIEQWLSRVKSTLVSPYQLIPHGYDLENNSAIEGVRGSSQALIHCFLPKIDSIFSRDQYHHFKEWFIDDVMGVPGVLEYPKGVNEPGDIDAGPIVAGFGSAATIVGIRAAAANGDHNHYYGLRNAVEGLLVPFSLQDKKRYLGGAILTLDAFLAWTGAINIESETHKPVYYFFHLGSVGILLALTFIMYKMLRKPILKTFN